MGQLTLFGTEPRPLPREDSGSPIGGRAPEAPAGSVAAPPEQIDLFAERARLVRDLEAALGGGDFLEAGRLRRQFEEAFGVSAESRALSFLEDLSEALASPQPEVALPAWDGANSALEVFPRLRRLLEAGVLGRLLRSHTALDLAAECPAAVPSLSRMLAFAAGVPPEDARRAARNLVRDALLAGRRLESLDFRWDEALADLLAEEEGSAWLACLGVIRRLWPAPRPPSLVVAALSRGFEAPESEEHPEAALAYWSCLQVAEDRGCDEAALHEARRRMKRLRPAFHELYMRRPVARG